MRGASDATRLGPSRRFKSLLGDSETGNCKTVSFTAVPGVPLIDPGDDLATIVSFISVPPRSLAPA